MHQFIGAMPDKTEQELIKSPGKLSENATFNYLYALFLERFAESPIKSSIDGENLGVYYVDELGNKYHKFSDCP